MPTPPERSALSRDAIVQTAIRLADQHGSESVTIRRVAGELGVTPMALYWHFRNKGDLLAGMADWVFAQMADSPDKGGSWEERLQEILQAELHVLRRYPALASLVLTHESVSPHLLRVMERALAALRDAGFPPREATQIVQHAQQTVVNLVLRQPGWGPDRDPREIEEREREALAMIRSLPPEEYPNIIEAAVPLSRCEDPDEYYRFGLDVLMAGITAMASRRSSEATPTTATGGR